MICHIDQVDQLCLITHHRQNII